MTANGAQLGAKTGLVMAVIYGLIVGFILTIPHMSGAFDVIQMILDISGLGFIIGIISEIPALILGSLIGGLIGSNLARLKKPPTAWQGALIGLVAAGGIILLIHSLFFDPASLLAPAQPQRACDEGEDCGFRFSSNFEAYLYLLALPSLIWLPAGGWMGQQLARTMQKLAKGQGFTPFTPPNQLDPATFIRQQHQITHRYEIDLALLRQGYDAQQIEAAWHNLHRRPKRNLRIGPIFRAIYANWIVLMPLGLGVLLVGWRLW